jgi:hypothetical protein
MNEAESRPTFGERRAGLLACLAAAHFALVCLFIWTDVAETSDSPAHRTMRTYKNLSGIFRDYRFFAPAVASDVRAGFFLERPDGTSTFQAFFAENLEVGFRFHCIIGASMRNDRLRDLMAQSWAAAMLGSHPDVSRVTVVAQSFDLPAMRDYAAGEQPRWKTVYAGSFDRKAEPSAPVASSSPSAPIASTEVSP